MNAIRQPTRDGNHGKAKGNNTLRSYYITIKFSPLNVFYVLVTAYWAVLLWSALS
jgi:hypothetical protein